ncbi:MarR family winged helix-turn-helix transcriptional regulator [Pseudodesulfovibrio sediminis]|uniref:HTH marR-type domain-containing protein n=1 Tax=Pseudodesulfovibrio sediminis TaxID=2810563 RepID=A0ABM7P506_9BACT|nr:MarR family transcriptional regulator [Pseudodesulfovibrio sediminis]BCS87932.1 hypothetical protein PSDVSF_11740 [Pseudodesulfovibrio sediminis]
MSVDKLNPREALGFLSWKVSRLFINELTTRFIDEGMDITVEQCRVLIPLAQVDGLSQGRLCNVLSQEKTGVSRLVVALEKRGLVRREASKEDRRVKHIFITDAGRELVEPAVDTILENYSNLVRGIDPEELAICKRVLWQILEPTLDEACRGEGAGR